ncbi:leucine zipper domain-containing protein, partial [Actinoallomurus acaciae]
MSHADAVLTLRAGLRLACLIVDDGWPVARAAEWYEVSWPMAKWWAERYRHHGAAGMVDRSWRPCHSPSRTSQPVVRKIVRLRWKQRLGPVQIAGRLGMPASAVHAVLTRCRLNRLSHIDRATGEPIRRCEHTHLGR